ncbi:MAG: asparagine synthase-related protein [Sulfurovum sp.]|nr:asparagine synthase-related protein [Sulfurovum sp.]
MRGIFKRRSGIVSPVDSDWLQTHTGSDRLISLVGSPEKHIVLATVGETLTSDTLSLDQNYKDNLLFIASGRLDNRDFLCKALNIPLSLGRKMDDTALMQAAYRMFGDDTPEQLLGDWIFAAYNPHRNELFLAQNHHGYGALYYYVDEEQYIFSSSLKHLLAHPKIPKEIDLKQVVARDIIVFGLEPDATFFKSVKLLNPAHTMRIGRTSHHKERYWSPETITPDPNITADDAAEEMRQRFTEAVQARLRSDGPVASMLSGGLDSGSVVTMAAALLKQEGERLSTFSHIPAYNLSDLDIGSLTGNERPNIEATAGIHTNITTHFLDSSHLTPLQGIRMLNDILCEPVHAAHNAYWLIDIFQQAKHMGHRVLLSGEMGNATISFTGIPYQLGFRETYLRYGLRGIVRKKLLQPLYRHTKGRWKQYTHPHAWQEYSYINPMLEGEVHPSRLIRQSGRPIDFNYHFASHTDAMLQTLMPGYNPRLRFGYELGQHFGLEFRDPTGDKRIVEFMLRVPNRLFINQKGGTKQMLKRMMQGRLPDRVLYQKSSGLQSADIVKRIQPDLPEIEEIIRNFSTDLYEGELFNRQRMLSDLQLLKIFKLNTGQTNHLLRSVGIMEFLNSYKWHTHCD